MFLDNENQIMKRKIIFIIIVMSLFLPLLHYAQRSKARAMLAKDRSRLEKKIAAVNTLLSETASKKEKSRNELAVIDKQIHLRGQLIETLENEILDITVLIPDLEIEIADLENDLGGLRKNYGATAQLTYKTYNEENIWLAILSAENLSEVYYRMVYFRQFSAYRTKQMQALVRSQKVLEDKISELNFSIKEKELRIQEKQSEVEKLEASKTSKSSLYLSLKQQESVYREELESQRLALKDLIENMDILPSEPAPTPPPPVSAEDAPKLAEKPKEKPKRTAYDPTGKDFVKQKGDLPWPVDADKSIIVGKYGHTEDEYGNKVKNDGIFVRTPKGQSVSAVYEGKVTAVLKVPASGTMVIVSHGDYRTVYANLRESHVSTGDIIKAKQSIGVVRSDPRTDETVFHFLVHKTPDVYLDPIKWLEREK